LASGITEQADSNYEELRLANALAMYSELNEEMEMMMEH
jgi:hypothetical protein